MTTRKTILGLVILALAVPVAAGPGKGEKPKSRAELLKETTKQVKTALAKNDVAGAKAAFAQAEKIRGDYNAKQFLPLAKAIGAGATHKNLDLAQASVEALGTLKTPGSGKLLAKLLNPPAKPPEDKLDLYKAAIAAAGSIHDADSVKPLEKLLGHAHPDIAVAAAEAFSGYRSLESKPRLALAKRLVKALAKQEKKVATTKDAEAKGRAERVQAAIAGGLAKLMAKDGLSTSAEWSAWLKQEAKNL